MKRKMVALLAAAMVLGSTATFVAAPSATSSNVKTESVSELKGNFTNAQCSAGAVTVETVSKEVLDSAVDAIVAQILQKDENKVEAQILALANVTVPGGKGTITFSVEGVKAGDTIKIGHQKADKTWEFFAPDSVKDGKVTATFSSLSPVAIVKVASEISGTTGGSGSGSNTGNVTTFPKAGVGVSAAALLAATGLAGAVVCKKKSN